MMTSANSPPLAMHLASGRHGTFTGLITTKQGKKIGGRLYGNDRVKTVFITGFSYRNLVQRSLQALPLVDADKVITKALLMGYRITKEHVETARKSMARSFERTLSGNNVSTNGHVYQPLVVNGTQVLGCRVYICLGRPGCHCRDCTGDPRATLPGTIYLQGLHIWSKVIDAAPNGARPHILRSPVSQASDALRRLLPIGRYVSYRLEPGTDFILRVGGTARDIMASDADEITHNAAEALTEVV